MMAARLAGLFAVTALGLSGLCAETSAAPPVMLVVSGVMAQTPTGAGDPNAVLCRAPQYIPGSGKIGPELCLHNSEWWKLAANGKDIAADGETLIDRPAVANPTGEGDPEAVTCRKPIRVSSPQDWVKRFGPEVCRTNRFWADIVRNNQIVNASGEVLEPIPSPACDRSNGGCVGTQDGPGYPSWSFVRSSASGPSGQPWQSSGRPP
ncbi:MAG TPA: hypothetical protein VFA87_03940 [Rhizomicrobium sp.]|nr:hypothetical protein [Rhizomicrobium sp.]